MHSDTNWTPRQSDVNHGVDCCIPLKENTRKVLRDDVKKIPGVAGTSGILSHPAIPLPKHKGKSSVTIRLWRIRLATTLECQPQRMQAY
jgi:hypothetical protein